MTDFSIPFAPPNNGQIRRFSFAENVSKKFANFRAFFPRVANKSLRKYRRIGFGHMTWTLTNRETVWPMLARGPGWQRVSAAVLLLFTAKYVELYRLE